MSTTVSLLCDPYVNGRGNFSLMVVKDGSVVGTFDGDIAHAVAELIGGAQFTLLHNDVHVLNTVAVDFTPIGCGWYQMEVVRVSDSYTFPGGIVGEFANVLRDIIL